MGVMEIAAALAGIKVALEIVTAIRGMDKAFNQAELKGKIVDLMDALVEAKSQVVSIQEEIAEKDRTIRELGEQLSLKEKMKYEKPYYWVFKDNKKEGPFCPKCWDSEKKQIHVILHTGGSRCPNCQNYYGE